VHLEAGAQERYDEDEAGGLKSGGHDLGSILCNSFGRNLRTNLNCGHRISSQIITLMGFKCH
jgi:hypothetical protein